MACRSETSASPRSDGFDVPGRASGGWGVERAGRGPRFIGTTFRSEPFGPRIISTLEGLVVLATPPLHEGHIVLNYSLDLGVLEKLDDCFLVTDVFAPGLSLDGPLNILA